MLGHPSGNQWRIIVSLPKHCCFDSYLIDLSAIRCYHCGCTTFLILHALRSLRMAFKLHAANKHELGFQDIYSGLRLWLHCGSLDIRELHFTTARQISGFSQNPHYEESEEAQRVQIHHGGDAKHTIIPCTYTRCKKFHRSE